MKAKTLQTLSEKSNSFIHKMFHGNLSYLPKINTDTCLLGTTKVFRKTKTNR